MNKITTNQSVKILHNLR